MMINRTNTLVAALLFSGLAVADVREEEQFTFELDSGGRFSLENVNGGITVVGGDGNEVIVIARKKADNQKGLDGIEILIDASSTSISIDTKLPKNKGWFGGNTEGAQVTYEVSLPATTNLDSISSVNGGVEIRGVFGEIEAETVNGGVDVEDISSDASLETVNGSITARVSSLTGDQRLQLETVNGRINVSIPENSDVTLSAETVNGSINADDFGIEADKGLIGRSLRGTVGDGSARLSADTVNGGVKIRKN